MAAEPAACVLSCPLASHLHCGKHFRKHAGKATHSGGGGCPITPGPIERLAGPGTRTLRKGTHRALGLMVPLARQTYGPDIRPTCRQGSHSSEKRSARGRAGPERRCGPDLTPEPSWTRSCGSAQCGRTRQRGRSAQLRASGGGDAVACTGGTAGRTTDTGSAPSRHGPPTHPNAGQRRAPREGAAALPSSPTTPCPPRLRTRPLPARCVDMAPAPRTLHVPSAG